MAMSMTPYRIAADGEISDLFAAGKTDGKGKVLYNFEWGGVSNEYVLFTATRHWVDQAAAEEWRDFLFSSSELYDLNIISVEIEDI
jgi:hypothetical protein